MLTVLSVAYPLVPVSEDTTGGAEQIVSALDRALSLGGHRSIVVAAEGSRVHGTHRPTPVWQGEIDDSVRKWAASQHRRAIARALQEFQPDIVHLHGLDFHDYLPERPVACLATLHLPPAWYPPDVFRLARPKTFYNCVSDSQRAACPPSAAPVRTILHGIDTAAFRFCRTKRNYALALGRICPEKGFHFAITAASRANVPLLVAGEVFPYKTHREYFDLEIRPRLSRTIRFIGPVGLRKKRRLLSGARCLLVPSTVAETSSLVAMEALASGTPVVAFRSGALPEIVEHGRTGFIVENESEMAEAIGRSGELHPEDCRDSALRRFSLERMAQDYLRAYREIQRDAGRSSSAISVKWRGEAVENRTSSTAL